MWASRDTGEQNNSKPDPRALIWSTSNTHLPDTTTLPRRHGSQPIAGARAAAQRRVPYIHLQHYTPPPRGARARTTHARTTHAPSPPLPLRARARTRGITRAEDEGGVSRAAVSSSSSDGCGYPVDDGVCRPSGSRPRRCVTPSARTHRLAPYLGCARRALLADLVQFRVCASLPPQTRNRQFCI